MMVEDRAGRGPEALQAAVFAMMGRAAQTPGLRQVFSLFESSTPQLYLDIDRTKAQMLGINVADVFGALQTYIGSYYVNDFNLLGRTFRVTAQAEDAYRLDAKDVLQIRVRNANGDTVPLGSFTTVSDMTGPYRTPRYNLYPAAELDGAPSPGYSQGQAIEIMEKLAGDVMNSSPNLPNLRFQYQVVPHRDEGAARAKDGAGPRQVRHEFLDHTGCDPPNAVGLAPVVTEGKLVKVGLQMLFAYRAGVRADEPALQQPDRQPWTASFLGRSPFGHPLPKG
jgi:AcrB/AcrD/AcrF family protein